MLNLRQARTLLLTHYAYMLEYRAEIFLWALSNSLPIILMGVWIQASSKGNFDFTPQEFARYFFSVFIVRQLTAVGNLSGKYWRDNYPYVYCNPSILSGIMLSGT
jgi:ABC-type uncharacterized transport system permease subunit